MHALAVASLLTLAFAGLWFGLVEDIKIAFAIAVVSLASATFVTFSGRPGDVPPPQPRSTLQPPKRDLTPMRLPVAVGGGLLIAAISLWFGLVEDIEIAMLLGVIILAGAVLATFRGKATF